MSAKNDMNKPDDSTANEVDVPRLVRLSLTPEQAENLADILLMTTDEGPEYAGWASPELEELRSAVDAAISDFKATDHG